MKNCPACNYVEKDDSSVFCQNCGVSFNQFGSNELIQKENQKQVKFISKKRVKGNKGNLKTLFIVSGIVVLIFGLFIGGMFMFINTNVNYSNYVDTINYSGLEGNFTDINLNIDNSIGNVEIFSGDLGQNSSFLIAQSVYSSNANSNIEDASKVNIVYSYDKIDISFKQDDSGSFFSNQKFKHNFLITINPNIAISSLQLTLSTGNVITTFSNQTIDDIHLETSTGNIDSSFTNIGFRTGNSQIKTSTGSIYLTLAHSIFNTSRYWDISTSTGNIESNLHVSSPSESQQTFGIQTSTGHIHFNRTYQTDLSESIDASTSTGAIHFEGVSKGKSFNYSNLKVNTPLTFKIGLETSTGDIDIQSSS